MDSVATVTSEDLYAALSSIKQEELSTVPSSQDERAVVDEGGDSKRSIESSEVSNKIRESIIFRSELLSGDDLADAVEAELKARQPLRFGDPLYQEIKSYKDHFMPLLRAELEEEERRDLEPLSRLAVGELVRRGESVTGMSASLSISPKTKERRKRDFIFKSWDGGILGRNKFTRGVPVWIYPVKYSKKGSISNNDIPKYWGFVLASNEREIRVRLMDSADALLEAKELWRIDRSIDARIVFRRMVGAINALGFMTILRYRLLEGFSTTAQRHIGTRIQSNKDDLFASTRSEQRTVFEYDMPSGPILSNDRIQNWVRRYIQDSPQAHEDDPKLLPTLNASQVRAIAHMFGNQISLVHGPPGTGKSKTLVRALHLLKSHFKILEPLLVCAYTNVALDNLVESIQAVDLKPLRIGIDAKMPDELKEWSFEGWIRKHPSWESLVDLRSRNEDIEAEIKSWREGLLNQTLEGVPLSSHMTDIFELEQESRQNGILIEELESRMSRDIFHAADVICTTSLTAGSMNFLYSGMQFPIVFMDEASMSTEPASLVPLMYGCQHLALIGDHCQLPPVIISPSAQKGGLACSLFERLRSEDSALSAVLDTQYRMHPTISSFPNQEFYGGFLKDGLSSSMYEDSQLLSRYLSRRRSKLTGLNPSSLFIHHERHQTREHSSYANYGDAQVVLNIVEDLLLSNPNLRGEDIGVISPYAAQNRLLQATLKKESNWERFEKQGYSNIIGRAKNIEVKTVDGFQGREKEVIIFSTVRNNSNGDLGFLADRRRMNVALTRAKSALFVVGNLLTLARQKHYSDDEDESVKMKINSNGNEWRNYVRFVIEREIFTEEGVLDGYRSQEEIEEFEKLAYSTTHCGS
ncbi:P-loop containing nucleoside triphosphate hydrolase protein [Serendipita vermifera]|nr:P-loop containing nucleoside triphosphate hydrolase protein [Serendipita vermifera]